MAERRVYSRVKYIEVKELAEVQGDMGCMMVEDKLQRISATMLE